MLKNKKYWLCQITGWGLFMVFSYAFVYYLLKDSFLNTETKRFYFNYALLTSFVSSIASTHLLRFALRKLNWQNLNSTKTFFTLVIGVIATTFFCYYLDIFLQKIPAKNYEIVVKEENNEKAIRLEKELGVENTDYYLYENGQKLDSVKYTAFSKIKKSTKWYRNKKNEWQLVNEENERFFGGLFNIFLLTTLWVLIYAVYHYIKQNRNNQIDKLKLEALVKSLELKTIKSHINPHFIFNALNSIRALVDENPTRARTAITELSNILRSSLQAEKLETVTLEQELDIVNDYLALEQMRFEERLQIELRIDEETLVEPVPPMMLQTLVENAIKHGISKQENGGKIIITSKYVNNTHELKVINTGKLIANKKGDESGFGIKSTQDRLNLLFQKHARFEIKQLEENMVESKIIMPKTF
jgi:two-component system, LytTR family, sensor kinase